MYHYHRLKKIHSPVEIANLIAVGKQAHGRNLWKEVPGGRELVFFDAVVGDCVALSEFGRRQKERARARAWSYPNGRKPTKNKKKKKYEFLW